MKINGILRQHVVEFVRGTGVILDGVVVASAGGTGPFTWDVPLSASPRALMTGCGSGGGGGGGYNATASRAGGGGGAPGAALLDCPLLLVPGASMTITVPAGGAGGAVAAGGTSGRPASVDGLSPRSPLVSAHSTANELLIWGGQSGGAADASNAGFAGYTWVNGAGNSIDLFRNSFFGPPANGASPQAGGPSRYLSFLNANNVAFNCWVLQTGAAGGAANTTGSSNGANGGDGKADAIQGGTVSGAGANGGLGNTTGTESRGGGGDGGGGLLSRWAQGGNGGANGADAPNVGGGGAGGGGDGAGGDGGDAYVAITYWSME
jgi:hypothetical protein